jgi:hypothetical protein
MAQTRKDLDALQCMVPGCTCGGTILVLTSKCHSSGLAASYDKSNGVMTFSCYVCGKTVGAVLVAEQPQRIH